MTERHAGKRLLPFEIQRQPDDTTCGATCLQAVYRYYGDEISIAELVAQVPTLHDGGTLGVALAAHALARGYRATIVTWNIDLFDPTWFELSQEAIQDKLRARAAVRGDAKLSFAADAYVDFLGRGGQIELRDLAPSVLRRYLGLGVPILTGLSATFLYRESRERAADDRADDVAGDPVGHFTVLTGYTSNSREVYVTDPLHPNPLSIQHTYPVKMERLIGAIYLGVLTYDANLVVIAPDS